MTGFRKYRYLIYIFLSGVISSCAPDPSMETLESYTFRFLSDPGNKMLAGESCSVTFQAQNNLNSADNSVSMFFDIIRGGGSVSQISIITDSSGIATVDWHLGGDSFEHLLRASAYKLTGQYLTSVDFTAYGFRENSWDKISCNPDGGIIDMVADTIDGITFMISGGHLYRQGSRYFQWEEVDDNNITSPRNIEIDTNRIIYISTCNGELLKSTDHGESWGKCTKPYPDNQYYFYMDVSNDNYIWAGKFDFPTRFSKDGGVSWQDAEELSTFLNGNTYRLKDGTLVNHGNNGTSRERFNISYDDGLTWISRETPGYSTGMYVNENDEIFIFNQDSGFTIYLTTDLVETYTRVHSVHPEWGTIVENNIINKWDNFYYIIVPGYGILKSVDLFNYENYWLNSNLNDLFIDHNGVLIAKDWDFNTVYYWKDSE
jgi:hypothetical protein